jgi:uncharacterized phiE125 gp8 family phage protein
MRTELVDIAATEYLKLTEAKSHLRVEHDEDDAYIRMLIKAARERAEAYTGLNLISKTINIYHTSFESEIEIPVNDLNSLESVHYKSTGGTWVELASDNFKLVKTSTGSTLHLESISDISTTANIEILKFQVTTGIFSNTAAEEGDELIPFPTPIRYAMLLMIRTMYDNREDIVTGTIVTKIPQNSEYLLQPYRTFKFK